MSRLPALAGICLALASPLAARSAEGQTAPARDVSGAAAIASAYGAITSTYRTPAHNRAVGGVANSYHLHGRAIDVARKPGVSHWQIAAALQKAGFVMIESLDEGDHSHFAFATTPAAATPPLAAAVKPPEPAKPQPTRVLADNHGVLLVDLPPAERPAATAASAGVSQVRGTKSVGNQAADGMPLAR
jgi:hypothetical protein